MAKKSIKDKNGKDILVDNPQAKVISLTYKGIVSDKYYFSEVINEYKLETGKKGKKKIEPKLKVKDGDKVNKGDELFSIEGKPINAKVKGDIRITKKYVSILSEANKTREYAIPKGTTILVKDGAEVKRGDQLTEGSLDLRELLRLRNKLEAQKYIIREIQYVYSSQGQPLNDKHIEIIAKQMFSRYVIIESGDTNLLPGEVVEEHVLTQANKGVKKPAKSERLLLGITKSSLSTDSFLSAASFQETPRVLIEAAINGKIDYLEGLKENVIIGRLIPAGTGYTGKRKRDVYEK
jgi:DNA-directed RNA polymerase subunit beta'